MLQVAVSLVLLIGAGLFLRTVQNLGRVDVGFNPANIVLFRVSPQLNRYEPSRIAPFYDEVTARVAAIPGVRAVGLSSVALLAGSVNVTGVYIGGRTYPPGEADDMHRVVVSPGLLRGAAAADSDRTGIRRSRCRQSAARGADQPQRPRSSCMATSIQSASGFGTSPERRDEVEVVGVVGDAKYNSVRDAAPPTMFVPYGQASVPTAMFEVRTDRDPMSIVGAIREAVRQIDPNLPVTNISTQAEQIRLRYEQEQLFARAYALFGGLAVVIASVGLFGLMSYSVARRTNEIGIRMALGAQRGTGAAPGDARVHDPRGDRRRRRPRHRARSGSPWSRRFFYGLPPTDVISITLATGVVDHRIDRRRLHPGSEGGEVSTRWSRCTTSRWQGWRRG